MPSRQRQRTPRRARGAAGRGVGMLVFFGALLAFFLIFGPTVSTQRARNVDASGRAVSAHEGLYISEIMSDNGSALPDEQGNFPDWVEIWNASGIDQSMGGLTLSNRADKAKFLFPDMVLKAGERLIVFCDNTNRNIAGQPLHAKFKLSSLACNVYLFDENGHVLHSVERVPTLNVNETYYMDESNAFVKGENVFSPGYPNTAEGHDAYMNSYRMDNGLLVLNELMAAPRSGLKDEDGDLSDWIELKNNSDATVDLSGYALSDNEQRPVKWVFPEGSFVAPHSTFLVFASGKNRANPGGYPHTNFSISAEGETITLSTRQGQLVDRIVFDNLPADSSYGRHPETGAWQVFTMGTPGAENDKAGEALADRYLRALNGTKVYISEAMSSNSSVPLGDNQPFSDWVELVNLGAEPFDLSGYGLSDNISWPRKWQFPSGVSIWPGEYKVVMLDKSAHSGANAASLHASYALARAGGETLTLSDPKGNVVDKMRMPALPSDVSYGRAGDREGFFYFNAPTPGAANVGGFPGFSAVPVLSNAGGLYPQNVTLAISADGASVRYTLDGSIPSIDNGIDYREPFTISETCVVRARSFTAGLQPSEVVTASFIMKTYFSMPVVSLVTDPNELWNEDTGMYASGRGVDLTAYKHIPFKNPVPTYRTFGKNFRPGYAEMFDSDTRQVIFSQGAEFGLIGQYSLDMPQKSFKVKAKASLGKRYFDARLFEDRPFEQYKSFVLRVSGNDCVWTRMVDGVQSLLIDQVPDTTVIHQAWKPVIVYLNGQYWGHYNLRERVSRYFVAQHEGIPMEQADDMTILEASWKSYYGSNKEYRAMVDRIRKSDPANNPDDLQYILDNVDVDNLFDFLSYQAFFANTDSGNIRFYRVPGGKWRWIIFDMDYGLFRADNNGIRNMMDPKGHGSNNDIDNSVWLKLLENKEMLDKFLTRFGQLFQLFTSERMLDQIDRCYSLLQPEMNMHFERWASYNLKNISLDQPQTVDGCMRYWNSRVDRLRNVVRKRPRYCWVQVKEWYGLSDEQMVHYFGVKPEFPEGTLTDKDDQI